MQAQKFDATKPHGTVFGHHEAQYVQNNVLYDATGEEIITDASTTSSTATTTQDDAAGFFLRNVLSGGPVLQGNIKRESEDAGLNWADVQDAALNLNVQKIKQGAASIWKLTEGAA